MVDRGRPVFAGGAVAAVVAGVVAMASHQPWLFPSLGPVVMLHVEKPRDRESSPRNTLIGPVMALLGGYGLLTVCGLTHHGSVLQEGVTGLRIVAAAGSPAVTALWSPSSTGCSTGATGRAMPVWAACIPRPEGASRG